MRKKILTLLIGLATLNTASASELGVSLFVPVIDKDPDHLHGYHAAVMYQPKAFIWDKIQVYFDAAYGHWWIPESCPNHTLSIFSVAPYLRIYLTKNSIASPYVEASLGLSYLSRTRFEDRRLGIHFSFQDIVGVGAAFGKDQKLFTTLSAMHYSNGSLSQGNSGITVPLIFTIGYRF